MRIKEVSRPISKIFKLNKEESELLTKAADKFKTYETEIVREALNKFYGENGIK